jgi:hypothetical protein
MYLQDIVKRARIPLRKQVDGLAERPFLADFGGAHRSALPPAPSRTFICYSWHTSAEVADQLKI